jgi:NADPH-dependent curcumin reductase CurA
MLHWCNNSARVGELSKRSISKLATFNETRFLHHMLYQRATIQGMLARDYVHRMDEMRRVVAPWLAAGEIVYEETVVNGFEHLPATLNSLFTGDHRGKLIVQV